MAIVPIIINLIDKNLIAINLIDNNPIAINPIILSQSTAVVFKQE